MLLPGAGFDVVPTDCIALQLKKLLPDAVSLQLAFATLAADCLMAQLPPWLLNSVQGGAIRKDGKIIRKPLGQKGMRVDFGMKKLFVMSIPWGDISTAYFTPAFLILKVIQAFPGKFIIY